ncbi:MULTISPECIES: glycosyl hydrolase family 18 protein [Micromonospora]|uniref:chitinase n=1 Tax=Micromonospora sicca TaxID=2202420 RepID=A0A317DDG4_9ACTN|nr:MULTISPECIES: glycosyl hydrolase family 18 protein [unclassified Micromonospora]MBM0229672.1 cellulose binding domain-containing protein [Micromonospora sp. ATA51]MDZ5442710.1 glycosyl hydrolase family 18 protein [Micromonospora sp. 4G57]MDZ5492190.1 glycosyl hydrolase family 18 protein [Micromonospora sp. 4G53]PWR12869.1 chitinase [Micromonospora sp. 4G51]
MKRSLRRSLWAGAVVALAVAAVPMATAAAAGSVTATFAKVQDWGTGHEGKVTVTNGTSASVDTWRIEFDLPSGTTISSFWDADVTSSGNHYVAVKKSWAGPLAPGASFSWGYNGTGPYAGPLNCTVNGTSCSGGGTPTTPPSPTASPTASPTVSPTTSPTTSPTAPPPTGDKKVVGYFAEWGVYARNYHVKNIHTSGSAAKLTHILYAFGNTSGGRCSIGDSYADYDKAYTAADSVDGVADTWDQPLRGSFNQLRKLKKMYPHLKVIWSFGGWTWSAGFTQAAQNPAAFADSCYNLVEDPRWADVFDGIDVDWEYPNACGLQCDASGPNAFKNVVSALRSRFGSSALVTAAITADGSTGGKIDATDYAGAAPNLNWLMPMTYDYFGAFNPQGPTAPHSPLTSYAGIPQQGFNADAAIQKLKSKGVPANKLLLGIGFYGRGWTGVSQAAPGGTATGPAPGTYEQGIEDYKVLKNTCPATGTVGGTAYAKCGSNWWGYDTPSTIGGKMTYAKNQGLGGAFFWELSGDTGNGELIGAIKGGLG